MTKRPNKKGQPWTKEDEAILRKLAKENTPTRIIALKLGRTEDAIRAKAQELGISLMPINKSPHGTK